MKLIENKLYYVKSFQNEEEVEFHLAILGAYSCFTMVWIEGQNFNCTHCGYTIQNYLLGIIGNH